MTTEGFPSIIVRKGLQRSSMSSISWCRKKMVRMEAMPYSRGIEVSAMGMQASSAIRRVMTSSKGCISPICRLPISRITAKRATNTIAVRIKMSPIRLVWGRRGNLCQKGKICFLLPCKRLPNAEKRGILSA